MTIMEISYLGHAAFKLKGKSAAVITDPFDEGMVGLKFPKHSAADIVTVSHPHPDHNATSVIENNPIVFAGPGEYESKGVDVLGISTFHDEKNGETRGKNTVFKIYIDGISIVHLGDLGHKLTEEQGELLDEIDVLLIPVGGFYTVDAKVAAEIATDLEPSIVIPMHYQRPGLNKDVFEKLSPVSSFLKEMGKDGIVPQPKLKVTKDSLPGETQVVVLE